MPQMEGWLISEDEKHRSYPVFFEPGDEAYFEVTKELEGVVWAYYVVCYNGLTCVQNLNTHRYVRAGDVIKIKQTVRTLERLFHCCFSPKVNWKEEGF